MANKSQLCCIGRVVSIHISMLAVAGTQCDTFSAACDGVHKLNLNIDSAATVELWPLLARFERRMASGQQVLYQRKFTQWIRA